MDVKDIRFKAKRLDNGEWMQGGNLPFRRYYMTKKLYKNQIHKWIY